MCRHSSGLPAWQLSGTGVAVRGHQQTDGSQADNSLASSAATSTTTAARPGPCDRGLRRSAQMAGPELQRQ